MKLNDEAGLYYWDTGGTGETIVFCHPATGSALSWPYQQPFFTKLGYRVVGYSRRGRHLSPAGSGELGTLAGDLAFLLDDLSIEKTHIVSVAAGGLTASDFLCSFPEKTLSLTVACSLFGSWDPKVQSLFSRLRPDGFDKLPPEFRELGPSYRSAYPAGVAQWLEIERLSRSPGQGVQQETLTTLNWEAFQKSQIPVFLLTGSADLYQPPSTLREAAKYLPGCKTLVVPRAGHALHWEQPILFNNEVLKFLRSSSA